MAGLLADNILRKIADINSHWEGTSLFMLSSNLCTELPAIILPEASTVTQSVWRLGGALKRSGCAQRVEGGGAWQGGGGFGVVGGGHTSRGKVAVEAARPARAPAATSTAGGMSCPCFCNPPAHTAVCYHDRLSTSTI